MCVRCTADHIRPRASARGRGAPSHTADEETWLSCCSCGSCSAWRRRQSTRNDDTEEHSTSTRTNERQQAPKYESDAVVTAPVRAVVSDDVFAVSGDDEAATTSRTEGQRQRGSSEDRGVHGIAVMGWLAWRSLCYAESPLSRCVPLLPRTAFRPANFRRIFFGAKHSSRTSAILQCCIALLSRDRLFPPALPPCLFFCCPQSVSLSTLAPCSRCLRLPRAPPEIVPHVHSGRVRFDRFDRPSLEPRPARLQHTRADRITPDACCAQSGGAAAGRADWYGWPACLGESDRYHRERWQRALLPGRSAQ